MQVIPLTTVLVISLFSNSLFAANVSKLFSKERFKIDVGSDLGVAQGDKICSYAENSEEVACGKVFKLKSAFAYVKVSPKADFAKVEEGQAIKIEKNGEMIEITAPDTSLSDGKAEMAVVAKLYSKQRFKINAGSDQGIAKKDYICVYSESNKRLACGRVFKTKKTNAYVKVKSKKQYSRVKEGLVVRVKRGKAYDDILLNTSSSSSGQNFRVHLAYAPGLISPYSYNAVEYPITEIFSPNDATLYTVLGGQLSFEYLLSESISFSLGVRYRSSPTDQVLTGNDTIYQENDTSASDIGILLDSYLYSLDLRPIKIRFGTGIDFDMSTVTFSSTDIDKQSSTAEQTFSATSNLSVIALRALVDIRYPVGMFSFGAGMDLEIPLAALGGTVTVDQEVTDAELAEFEEALGHTKSSFALGFVFDAAIAF